MLQKHLKTVVQQFLERFMAFVFIFQHDERRVTVIRHDNTLKHFVWLNNYFAHGFVTLKLSANADSPLVDGIMALEFEETLDGASNETSNTRAPI